MQFCDSTCHHCATVWFRWLRAREAQMRHAKPGHAMSFAEAAVTSIRVPRLAIGDKVHISSLDYTHDARVAFNTGQPGIDGRHWVQVHITTPSGESWYVHVEASVLLEVP